MVMMLHKTSPEAGLFRFACGRGRQHEEGAGKILALDHRLMLEAQARNRALWLKKMAHGTDVAATFVLAGSGAAAPIPVPPSLVSKRFIQPALPLWTG